jgi:hypothetical protein
MSDEHLKGELERLRKENEALKKVASSSVRMKVSFARGSQVGQKLAQAGHPRLASIRRQRSRSRGPAEKTAVFRCNCSPGCGRADYRAEIARLFRIDHIIRNNVTAKRTDGNSAVSINGRAGGNPPRRLPW